MLLTNIYLLFIYILFIYIIVLAAVAVALFVALMVTIRKLDKIKNTSLRRTVAVLLTILLVLLVLSLVFWLLVPQLIETVQMLVPKLYTFFSNIGTDFNEFLRRMSKVEDSVLENGYHILDSASVFSKKIYTRLDRKDLPCFCTDRKFTLFSISAGVIQLGSDIIFNEVLHMIPWLSYLLSLILSILWNFTFSLRCSNCEINGESMLCFKITASIPSALNILIYWLCCCSSVT